MTASTAPDLAETIAVLGEIRDKLSAYPRYVEALMRAQEGLQEAGHVVEPWANIDTGHLDDWELMRTTINVGRVNAARDWLSRHGIRP